MELVFHILSSLGHFYRRVDFLYTYHYFAIWLILTLLRKFLKNILRLGSARRKRKEGSSWLGWLLASLCSPCYLVAGLVEEFLEPPYTPLCVIYDIYALYDCCKKIACFANPSAMQGRAGITFRYCLQNSG